MTLESKELTRCSAEEQHQKVPTEADLMVEVETTHLKAEECL